jgi:hypothetical protein
LAPACRAGPLATLLTAATDDDATGRPAAAELARALFDTGPAAPILPAGSTPTPEQPPMPPATPRSVARHRRARRVPYRSHPRWVAALVAAMAAVAAALTGLAWAGAQPGAPGATVAARAPATSYADPALSGRWRSVLVALDGRRAAAFATGKVDALVAVYAAGSPALRRDQRQLHELSSAGLHIERLRLRPSSVRVTTTSDSRVVLTVVDVLEPYDIRTARGALVASRPGRGPTRWQVTLARDGGEWRVDDVVAR